MCFILASCATVEQKQRQSGTIGPCYGGGGVGAEMYQCFRDIDYDEKPDIILTYAWNGEKMVLVSTEMLTEGNERL